MIIDEIKEKILNFNDQNLMTSASYISKLFKDYKDLNSILLALKDLLKDNDDLILVPSLDFFVYLMNNSNYIPGKIDDIFLNMIEEDYEIFKILNEQLYSKNFYIRQNIINALVELKYEDCLKFLIDSFDFYLKNDPINLPTLINSIFRLNDEIPIELIDEIVKNENYIVRWSFLKLIELINLDYSYLYTCLSILKQDKNEEIKNESNYWYDYFKKIEKNNVSDVYLNDKNFYKDDDKPTINFENVINNFYIVLEKKDKNNFNIEDLDDFIKYFKLNYNDIIDKYLNKANGT